ncbi:MAG: Fur family transcriptional regulator [Acidimicrobiia bacterium]
MQAADELTGLFRAEGLRVTPQRQVIFRLLTGNDRHPTVDSLYDAARAEMPTISLKTVYQTVHDLEALGQVTLLDLGTGSVRVDPNVEAEHQHLVCSSCGLVCDVPLAEVPKLPARFRRDFRADAVEVIFRGECEQCAAQSSNP